MQTPYKRFVLFCAISLIAAFLVACGGGSNSSNVSNQPVNRLSASLPSCSNYKTDIFEKIIYLTIGGDCSEKNIDVTFFKGDKKIGSLNISVGDSKTVDLEGFDYKVEVFKENTWRVIENKGAWIGRDGAGLLVFKGRVYLFGGWNPEPTNSEVWVTEDLHKWERLPNAPWVRHGAGWVVHNGKMFVIGGDLFPDVWSTEDGVNWNLIWDKAPFGERYTPIVHSVGDYIYLYGGLYWEPVRWCYNRPDCVPVGLNDVWRSKDGVQWERIATAEWEGRGLIHGGLYFNNEFFLVGGGLKNSTDLYMETYTEFSDIWSSKDAINWTLRKSDLGFVPRTHFSVLSTSRGCYVSDGSRGTQVDVSKDFFFASDCVNYKRIEVPDALQPRHASSLFEFNGSIVLLGGPPRGNSGTAIWQYFPPIKE